MGRDWGTTGPSTVDARIQGQNEDGSFSAVDLNDGDLEVKDFNLEQVMCELLTEARKINHHLSIITGEE